jgi:hypothetical protein
VDEFLTDLSSVAVHLLIAWLLKPTTYADWGVLVLRCGVLVTLVNSCSLLLNLISIFAISASMTCAAAGLSMWFNFASISCILWDSSDSMLLQRLCTYYYL